MSGSAGRGAAGLRQAAAGTLLASFPGDTVPPWLWRRVDEGLGGVCLYGSNREAGTAAVAAALHAVRGEVVVALDEEGGDVTRLEAITGSSVPGNAALGAVDDVDLTRSVAVALGLALREAGVDLDLAPCADVNSDPTNPVIGVRSFGADPHLVARHTAAFVAGLQSAGVSACAKHFPGHGAVDVDSHHDLPILDAPGDVLEARELAPFRAAVAAGVAAVMPGHLLVPALDEVPATVSRRVLADLLRGELGFDGVVVTDALDMGGAGGPATIPANVVRALSAGADLCCLGPDNDDALIDACLADVVAAVERGELAAARVADAARRVAGIRVGATADPTNPAVARAGVDAARGLAAIGAEAARRAVRVDGELPAGLAGAHVVELDRPTNIAAGSVPWGVGAALRDLDPTATVSRVPEGDERAVASALLAARRRPLVVVARDPQRRRAQAAALRTLLTARPDAVLVDMGWPAADGLAGAALRLPTARTHVTTFGASRASGEAVARLLTGTVPHESGRVCRG